MLQLSERKPDQGRLLDLFLVLELVAECKAQRAEKKAQTRISEAGRPGLSLASSAAWLDSASEREGSAGTSTKNQLSDPFMPFCTIPSL